MAQNIIATVGIEVDTSDINKLNRELDSVQNKAKDAARDVGKIGSGGGDSGSKSFGAKFALGLGAVAAAATAAAGAVGAFALNAINNIDSLNDAATRAGISIERFSELKFAADLSGTNIDTLSKGLLKLGEDAANGGKKLEALGISVRDANGDIKSSDQLLLEVADKFKGYQDGTQEAALAAQLFGRQAGPELQELLNRGSEGIEELAGQARNLGVVISEETAEAAGQFNDNLDKLKATSSGAGTILAAELLPILNQLTGDVNGSTSAFGEFATSLAKVVGFAVKVIVNLGQVIAGLAKIVGTTIAVIVDTFVKGFENISDVIDLFKKQLATVVDAAKLVGRGEFSAAADALGTFDDNIAQTYERIAQRGRDLLENATSSYEEIFSGTVDNIVGIWNPVNEVVEKTGEAAEDALPQPPTIREAAAATRELTDATKAYLSELEKVKGIGGEIKGVVRDLEVVTAGIAIRFERANRTDNDELIRGISAEYKQALDSVQAELDRQAAEVVVTLGDAFDSLKGGGEEVIGTFKELPAQIAVALATENFAGLTEAVERLKEFNNILQAAPGAEMESASVLALEALEQRLLNIITLQRQFQEEQAKGTGGLAPAFETEAEIEASRIILELDKAISQENTIQKQIKDGIITSQDELTRILEVERELQEIINDLNAKGIKLTEEQTRAIEERIRKRREEADETNEELRKREEFDEYLEETIGSVGDLLSDSIIEGLETGKFSFKQFLYDLGKMLLSSAIKKIFASLFEVDINTSGGGNNGGGFWSSLVNAFVGIFTKGGAAKNGGTFDGSSANFFANGGVVNKRTMFSYSNGAKRGVMGEAGPEAILPLAKTTSGKLGVMAQGVAGGGVVTNNYQMAGTLNINVESSGDSNQDAAETAKAFDKMLNNKFKQFVADQQRSGGQLNPRMATY